ncbi:hypothetical protein BpHYR1_002098 [Brachionus plicatilis]|uniref:Uncharacterized protein n=1 Tax=Brachionus plicatilis TaxID=10195 RepID=A0A3M7T8Q7_BRAPC|nr:hypothetical protein BpHYR1_002098 [Brachionus plicatilis]
MQNEKKIYNFCCNDQNSIQQTCKSAQFAQILQTYAIFNNVILRETESAWTTGSVSLVPHLENNKKIGQSCLKVPKKSPEPDFFFKFARSGFILKNILVQIYSY